MKNMNKNIVSKILITTCLFSLFLFFSCSNLLDNQSDVQNIPQGKGYLVINSGDLIVNRSIDPPSNEEILNSFISFNLSGSGKDANNKSISISSISAGNITELYKKQIILDAGTWSFTLTALIKNSQLGNVNFSSTVSDVLIEAGKNNSVSFNLEPTDSDKGNGSLSVKLYLDKKIIIKTI